MATPAYLGNFLQPLAEHLDREDITDIYVNRPGELWLESMSGGVERIIAPELTAQWLDRLARQIAAFSNQGINRDHPILSAWLPSQPAVEARADGALAASPRGARVQVIAPPATRGWAVMAIRKHLVMDRSLADYAADGSFIRDGTATHGGELAAARAQGGDAAMLALAVRQKHNILISGGTSTGKSTFLNALLREIPDDERLILIEDTPELQLRHENAIGLLAARSQLGQSLATPEDLLNASLRMRPDRIILGEIRGSEAFTLLRAINSGHPGSMSTIHADSPARAIEQLALLALQTGTQLRREDVVRYIENVIDIFVQLERRNGERRISEVRLNSRLAPLSSGAEVSRLRA